MANLEHHYTYLITNLNPINDLQFYIGVKSCDCPPDENTDYMGSSSILTEDIKLHGDGNFEKIVIAEFSSRLEAEIHENALHVSHNVASNPIFYNKKNGIIGFHATPESTQNLKNTVNDTNYKKTKGAAAIRKQKATKNDPTWKATKGKEQVRKLKEKYKDIEWKEAKAKKQSDTLQNLKWKETTGEIKIDNFLKTITNPLWLVTKGIQRQQKRATTISDPNWQATILKEQKIKEKETKSSDVWIDAHTVECAYCHLKTINSGAFQRWHGKNCRSK